MAGLAQDFIADGADILLALRAADTLNQVHAGAETGAESLLLDGAGPRRRQGLVEFVLRGERGGASAVFEIGDRVLREKLEAILARSSRKTC